MLYWKLHCGLLSLNIITCRYHNIHIITIIAVTKWVSVNLLQNRKQENFINFAIASVFRTCQLLQNWHDNFFKYIFYFKVVHENKKLCELFIAGMKSNFERNAVFYPTFQLAWKHSSATPRSSPGIGWNQVPYLCNHFSYTQVLCYSLFWTLLSDFVDFSNRVCHVMKITVAGSNPNMEFLTQQALHLFCKIWPRWSNVSNDTSQQWQCQ